MKKQKNNKIAFIPNCSKNIKRMNVKKRQIKHSYKITQIKEKV